MVNLTKLIIPENLKTQREYLRQMNKRLVLTNGCFDLLHAGHVYVLESAAKCGDILWVGVNSDMSIRCLKGPARPIYPEQARLYLLNALHCIDGIFLFNDENLAQEIALIKPDIYVKGDDYSLEKLNPAERQALEACHSQIIFLSLLPGWSTTNTLNWIHQLK